MTDFVKYVDPTATGSNNGGAGNDAWQSLKTAADAAVTINSNDTYTIYCTGGIDTDKGADFTKWTCNGKLYVRLTTPHAGVFDTGNYYLAYTLGASEIGLSIGIRQHFIGIQMDVLGTHTGGDIYAVKFIANGATPSALLPTPSIRKSILRYSGNMTGNPQLNMIGSAGWNYVNNNIIYNVGGNPTTGGGVLVGVYNESASQTTYAYNNTVVGMSHNYYCETAGRLVAYNCIGQDGYTADYRVAFVNDNYCVSEDASADGTGSAISVTAAFVGAANFHITTGGTNTTYIIAQGFDLSGQYLPVTDDIDGDARPTASCLGADELVGNMIYIGPDPVSSKAGEVISIDASTWFSNQSGTVTYETDAGGATFPAGIDINPTTGEIAGTLAEVGTVPSNFDCTDDNGTVNAAWNWIIDLWTLRFENTKKLIDEYGSPFTGTVNFSAVLGTIDGGDLTTIVEFSAKTVTAGVVILSDAALTTGTWTVLAQDNTTSTILGLYEMVAE